MNVYKKLKKVRIIGIFVPVMIIIDTIMGNKIIFE